MATRIYRILFLLFVIAGSIRLSAQTSDAGVWIVGSKLEESSFVDEGDELTIDFDEEVGFGISFNHFWTERIYFVGEMKYIPWEAFAEGDTDADAIDVDPITFAAGVKVRF